MDQYNLAWKFQKVLIIDTRVNRGERKMLSWKRSESDPSPKNSYEVLADRSNSVNAFLYVTAHFSHEKKKKADKIEILKPNLY